MTSSPTADGPETFRAAVASMHDARVRSEISVGAIRPPQRLAPYSHAIGLEVLHPETASVPVHSDGDAFGRLILLHDPDGDDAWDGTLRLVAYVQADVDASLASDPLLPEVAWSWLREALTENGAVFRALGGTITATTSVRFGDIAGPPRAHQLEMRASWTADGPELARHVEAFSHVLASVAGMPPEGVTGIR